MNTKIQLKKRGNLISAQGLFFPTAAIYAAIAAPLSVYAMLHNLTWLPGFTSPTGHAQELLFGFALAVVAGFLINRCRRTTLAVLFVLWLGARITFIFSPGSLISGLFNISFVVLLLAIIVPQFMKAAKKWRNKAIGPILLAIGMALLIFHITAMLKTPVFQYRSLYFGILMLTLLMLFMGGRAIAPAAAGHIRLKGGHLETRVQPRLEGAQLLLVMGAALTVFWPAAHWLTGLALFVAAVVSLVRMMRWQLWRCFDRPDLSCLGIGYVWLVFGLALLGTAYAFGLPSLPIAVHAITIGALGTLTITMMGRTRLIGLKQAPNNPLGLRPAIALVAVAAVLRMGWPNEPRILIIATLIFSSAFLILFFALLIMKFTKIREVR